MKTIAVVLCAVLALPGCATEALRNVSVGQAADSVSTVVALSQGLVEANPLVANVPALLVVKPLAPYAAKAMTDSLEECTYATASADVIGLLAASTNIGTLCGAPAAGLVVGIAAAGMTYDRIISRAVLSCWDKPLHNKHPIIQL